MSPSGLHKLLSSAACCLGRAGVPEPRADAEILLAHTLGHSREFLLAHGDDTLAPREIEQFDSAIRLRSTRRPLAYIIGKKEFCGLDFEISDAVMVPRPETELLVEGAIALLNETHPTGPVILEIGTGSGNIAVAIAKEVPTARVVATDLSPEALRLAARNASRLGVGDRVAFVACDLFTGLKPQPTFDAIVSNPPYIPTADIEELQPETRDHEPRAALDGGSDGLSVIRAIAAGAARYLKGGGTLALEIGVHQADEALEAIERIGLGSVRVRPDYSGVPRVVTALKAPD